MKLSQRIQQVSSSPTIAITAARVIEAEAYEDLSSQWRSALDALLAEAALDSPNEAIYEAVLQILDAASAT